MNREAIPDTDKWLEAENLTQILLDKNKNIIGISRYYIRFETKFGDKPSRQFKQKCLEVYFFEIKSAICWTNFEKIGDKFSSIEYAAILLDQKSNSWAIGKQQKMWGEEIDYDENQKPVGIKLSLETEEGIKSAYIPNLKPLK